MMNKELAVGSGTDPRINTYGLIVRRPPGVVGAIVTWNVVAKPSDTIPLTTLGIAEIMHPLFFL